MICEEGPLSPTTSVAAAGTLGRTGDEAPWDAAWTLQRLDRYQTQLEALEHHMDSLRNAFASLSARVDASTAAQGRPDEGKASGEAAGRWEGFYKRFEAAFRGEERTIVDRLARRYELRLRILAESFAPSGPGAPSSLDLGCGRGEFGTLARRLGYLASGVDSSSEFVADIRARGEDAAVGDILEFLRRQNEARFHFISCMHVIEHVPPEYALAVFAEVYRVLVPGGVFLVETPAAASLWSGHRQFYLDPTHLRPIHPDLVVFMARDVGFAEATPMGFDPPEFSERPQLANLAPQPLAGELRRLEDWLYGPADFACWAVK